MEDCPGVFVVGQAGNGFLDNVGQHCLLLAKAVGVLRR